MNTYVLWSAESDTGDAIDMLQSKLGDGLASLLLVARVDSDRGTCGDVGLALLSLRLVAGVLLLDLGVLLLGLVGELFNAWVGHLVDCGRLTGRGVAAMHGIGVGASNSDFSVVWALLSEGSRK